jgi:integrase
MNTPLAVHAIARAKSIVATDRVRAPTSKSEKTQRQYRATYQHFREKADTTIVEFLLDTAKKKTYNFRRAALLFALAERISYEMEVLEKLVVTGDIELTTKQAITVIDLCDQVDSIYEFSGACPIENAKRRHSKLQDMRGLPQDWRQQVITLLSERCLDHYVYGLVSALSGCRPCELHAGIKLTCRQGRLDIVIKGGKVKSNQGQPYRLISYDLLDSHPLVSDLIKFVRLKVKDGDKLSVQCSSPKRWSDAVKAAAKRLWPNHEASITAYCFRHAFASDVKENSYIEEIAKALGHSVDETQKYYGKRAMACRGNPLHPILIEASRPIKCTRRMPYSSCKNNSASAFNVRS